MISDLYSGLYHLYRTTCQYLIPYSCAMTILYILDILAMYHHCDMLYSVFPPRKGMCVCVGGGGTKWLYMSTILSPCGDYHVLGHLRETKFSQIAS